MTTPAISILYQRIGYRHVDLIRRSEAWGDAMQQASLNPVFRAFLPIARWLWMRCNFGRQAQLYVWLMERYHQPVFQWLIAIRDVQDGL